MLPVAECDPTRTPTFDLHQRIGRPSIFDTEPSPTPYDCSQAHCRTAVVRADAYCFSVLLLDFPPCAGSRSSSRRNKFMQYLLTVYIDRLRPRPPPHQAAPFALGTHVPILNAARLTRLCASNTRVFAKRKTAAEQRLCAPSRSHRRANAHPYTVILRVASTTRARPQSSPPEARNQGSVSHPPCVNAPLRTNRAKLAAACYQTGAFSRPSHIQLNKSLFLPSPRASPLNQRRKSNSKENQSDVMSTMSSLGAAPNLESLPSQRSRVLLLSYP
ncbi:hypothetical protein B0H16DRAFT_1642208 [Mycena metata]|uniref:Uncharacterized protein n=1 Tax=Mycena metata TaxID=1033252 RepID=A0AAD7GLQ9_9AGAR|nr:hypothetical protein B0H16DRAFT_1642208 [Mycena metata]